MQTDTQLDRQGEGRSEQTRSCDDLASIRMHTRTHTHTHTHAHTPRVCCLGSVWTPAKLLSPRWPRLFGHMLFDWADSCEAALAPAAASVLCYKPAPAAEPPPGKKRTARAAGVAGVSAAATPCKRPRPHAAETPPENTRTARAAGVAGVSVAATPCKRPRAHAAEPLFLHQSWMTQGLH